MKNILEMLPFRKPAGLCGVQSAPCPIMVKRNVFVVSSAIQASKAPLCYTPTRSVYSTEERFEQTLASIQSIRDRTDEATIFLTEASALAEDMREKIRLQVDFLADFSGNPQATRLCNGPYKGATEAFMLLGIMNLIRQLDYTRLFKLSGRYRLSDRFSVANFPADRFGFLLREGSHSTRLYCVPKTLESLYIRQLAHAYRKTLKGHSIETEILRGVSPTRVAELETLGVCGHIGPSGEWIDE